MDHGSMLETSDASVPSGARRYVAPEAIASSPRALQIWSAGSGERQISTPLSLEVVITKSWSFVPSKGGTKVKLETSRGNLRPMSLNQTKRQKLSRSTNASTHQSARVRLPMEYLDLTVRLTLQSCNPPRSHRLWWVPRRLPGYHL